MKQADRYHAQANRTIDAWEQDIAEGKSSPLSEDDLAILRAVVDQFLSGLRGYVIERARGDSSFDMIFVNREALSDIVNAESREERFLASLRLGFNLLGSLIPPGGGPESVGAKIDEIRKDLGDYILALKDSESLRAFARRQHERKQEACRKIPVVLDTYEPTN